MQFSGDRLEATIGNQSVVGEPVVGVIDVTGRVTNWPPELFQRNNAFLFVRSSPYIRFINVFIDELRSTRAADVPVLMIEG